MRMYVYVTSTYIDTVCSSKTNKCVNINSKVDSRPP